jgi:cephalosporin-C deacetylase
LADTKPDGFEQYWEGTLEELAGLPARTEVELVAMRETDYATAYGVHFTGLGSYRLFAYLSIPKGEGPFPALYYTAGYGSVVTPIPQGASNEIRSRHVTFSIAARGSRNADKPYAAAFPGLLTDGIEHPAAYRLRGIAADCVRGLEVLLARPEVDTSRVVLIGADMALLTAGLASGVSHVVAAPALLYKTLELAGGTKAYPLQEINDYLRVHRKARPAVTRTLSNFDVRWHAPGIGATTLIKAGPPNSVMDQRGLASLTTGIAGPVTVHESENSGYKDGIFADRWVASQLGFDAPILPEHWR